jgi:hypothetical protein
LTPKKLKEVEGVNIKLNFEERERLEDEKI